MSELHSIAVCHPLHHRPWIHVKIERTYNWGIILYWLGGVAGTWVYFRGGRPCMKCKNPNLHWCSANALNVRCCCSQETTQIHDRVPSSECEFFPWRRITLVFPKGSINNFEFSTDSVIHITQLSTQWQYLKLVAVAVNLCPPSPHRVLSPCMFSCKFFNKMICLYNFVDYAFCPRVIETICLNIYCYELV